MKLRPNDERADHDRGQEAPQVVDGFRGLVDMGRDMLPGHVQGDDRQRQRDEEHRPPYEVQEQEAGDEGTQHRDATTQC